MKKYLLHIVLFFCIIQQFHSQEDGVVAFNIPVRNSLKFNRHFINPTFSFVREQNKYISFSNKREWVQFDNAPQTYLFGYTGRFRENIGAGVSLFQQNYGVLTTFGGVVNFAYNAVLDRDNNLTFGMNFGFYKSGINEGNVVTNFPDSSLDNFPANSIITINPGINYGTQFFDFGVSINNLVSYNFTTSKMIEDDPEQGIQGHIMYTGYLNSRGFFDESRFSGLISSEVQKDQTVISGMVMLMVPKGIWAQAGYNSLYALSVGIGLNITTQIAFEYNYEKGVGGFSTFGNSHEVTLAYKFKNSERYSYSGDDDERALINVTKKSKPSLAKRKPTKKVDENTLVKAEVETKTLAEESQAKIDAETMVNLQEAEAQEAIEIREKTEAEAKRLKDEAQAEAKLLEQEIQAKADAEEKVRVLQEREQARIAAENKAIEETKAKRLEEEVRLKAKAAAEANRLAEEAQAIIDAENKAIEEEKRLAEEAQAKKLARVTQERLEAEQKNDTVQLEGILIPISRDRHALAMESLTKLTTESKIVQQNLLTRLREKIASKQKDLDDLKEENDLSEQGVFNAPKPFKSVAAENAIIESLIVEIDNIIDLQNNKISELENLYNERLKSVPSNNDEVNAYYLNEIQKLKSDQLQALQTKQNLVTKIETIKVATDFERKRRIKRAAYDNEEVRYAKDRAALDVIKKTTPISNIPLEVDDFDFGEDRSNNIQIVKDVTNVESGYYLVLAVHTDVSKRDDFLKKAVAAGKADINFFYDVNTSKYYIYYEKFNDIGSARRTMDSKGNHPYNSKMSMVKIDNK
jgi:type IX secretion system PorP/SprF family membrane protein